MRKFLLTVLSLLLLPLTLLAKSMEVEIRSQEEFDRLGNTLAGALKGGFSEINVRIAKGVYYFRELHLQLLNYSCPGTVVVLDGGGATFIGSGEDLLLKRRKKGRYTASYDAYDWRHGVVETERLADVPPFGPLRRALGPVEIVDAKAGLCRFAASEQAQRHPERMFVRLTSWYLAMMYPVEKIADGYVWFRASDLSRNGAFYNVEGDRSYGGTLPKYQIVNSPEADVCWADGRLRAARKGEYHICRASQFLQIGDCKFKSLEIRNFQFLGNSDLREVMMHVYRTTGDIHLHDCTFRGIRNHVVSVSGTKAVRITDCRIEGCYRGFFRDYEDASGSRICRNTFRNNQLLFNNFMDVICRGKDFLVSENIFSDFSYSAIGIGTHFASEAKPVASGVVEKNEIFYSDAFRKEPSRTLMDSGAIYCWTGCAGVIIRDNYIHDYTGGKDNRGIFGDDGTCNVTVSGNRILRIGNSFCIDFRRVESVETRADSRHKKVNTGIKMYDNTVDGTVRFEPRPGDKTSRLGANKFL